MTYDIVGRDLGSYMQHLEQISHHLSVIRAHVSFVLGRSGPYLTILDMMETAVVKRWKGSLRVKSSCIDVL